MAKVKKTVDVRSKKDVPAFEQTIIEGPITVVLVYADWCGHCTKFKKNIWEPLNKMHGRKLNMVSVHHDMLEKTSQANAKIRGYPSVLVVGKDGKAASYNDEEGNVTNAAPNTTDLDAMKTLVTTDPEEVMNDEEPQELNFSPKATKLREKMNEELLAPDIKKDMKETMVGGTLFQTLSKLAEGITGIKRKTRRASKRRSSRKTRQARH
uniref:Thioredoxin domain-containing protein n=1 Tax=viral metagenome TaxID=1070528 RepID=A0A6C0BCI7_9ZZZZ